MCEGKAADPQFAPQINAYQDLLRGWGRLVDDPWPRSAMGGEYYNVQDNPEGEIQMHGLDERDTGPGTKGTSHPVGGGYHGRSFSHVCSASARLV